MRAAGRSTGMTMAGRHPRNAACSGEVADRVLFMDGGVIVESGTPDEVLSNPKHERTQKFLSSVRA